MSRWFGLKRTSSSSGKSHSKRTIRVCTSLKTLVTLSSPIIQPMSWSSTASRNGRVLVRLSILSTDRMATLFLSLNASVPTRIQWFLKFYFQGFPAVVGVLIVQTPHLCLQDLLPTSTYQSYLFLFAYLQASCRSSHLSKHLTCVSRTYSQPQPVEILSTFISRQVVGVFTVQTPHLCLQDLLPTSAYRDILNHFKKMSFQAINWQVTFIKWPYSQHAQKWSETKTRHLDQEY